MATSKSTAKEVEFTEPVREFSGVWKENYINGVDFTFSILDQNIKAFNAHLDQLLDVEKEFVHNTASMYKDFEKDLPYVNGTSKKVTDQLDKYFDIRKEQIKTTQSLTEKFAKDVQTIAHDNIERTFSLFGDYLSTFKVN